MRDDDALLLALLLGGALMVGRRPGGGGGGGSRHPAASSLPIDFSSQYSTVARRVPNARDPLRGLLREPYGLLVHTTGSGVTAKAKASGRTPLAVALAYYVASQNDVSGAQGYTWGGPAYVVDYDGTLHQLAPDNVLTHHAGPGKTGTDALYRAGTWESEVSPLMTTLWRAKWPLHRHPYALFPSGSPNADYVGVEMLPIADGFGGKPMAPGLRFTRAQHDAIARLGRDLASRHGWPAGWGLTSRLVGHEDVDPINRDDARGGWDPGYLRQAPWFDFAYVRKAVAS